MNNKYNNIALLCALATLGTAHADPYVENGRTGNADSWRSSEFNADWGLGGRLMLRMPTPPVTPAKG